MSDTLRIIVRGTNQMGDSVITIPAVRALRAMRRSNPKSQIQPAMKA